MQTIQPHTIFRSLVLMNGEDQWDIPGADGETVAGMLVAILNIFGRSDDQTMVQLNPIDSAPVTIDLIDPNEVIRLIPRFIAVEDIDPTQLVSYSSYLRPRQMGWWIRNVYRSNLVYNLYRFRSSNFIQGSSNFIQGSSNFIQGFINIFEYFNLDFRDYIAGPPFTYSGGIHPESIVGYDIGPLELTPRVAATTMPYESMTYEIGNVEYD